MSKAGKSTIRCAIYTRKSSDEGLDQEFNSLEAQREACAAYIKSQAHEGWQMLPGRFDDGGYSGGTLERPALQQLLALIKERRVDVIVIYKIDRLTRSLMDFASLASEFEAHGTSFVSVTQQFNTTTSMGRLMLNVLLSFAQFERELTGERIRDKIAASKKKGMWMGGTVPLGYDAKDRTLIINEGEAETVRTLFRLYRELGAIRLVWLEAQRQGLRTKPRIRSGKPSGGSAFSAGHIHHILKCPIYIGRIPHKGESYPGTHPALIDQETWDAVQTKLKANLNGPRIHGNTKNPSPLAGLISDANGNRYTTAHAQKGKVRYRYYIDKALLKSKDASNAKLRRVPAVELEEAVRKGLCDFLSEPCQVFDAIGDVRSTHNYAQGRYNADARCNEIRTAKTPVELGALIRPFLAGVILHDAAIHLQIDRETLRQALGLPLPISGADTHGGDGPRIDDRYTVIVPAQIRIRGKVMKLHLAKDREQFPSQLDPALIKAVARAHAWWSEIRSGRVTSITDFACAEGVTRSYLIRILRLAFLSPNVVEAILEGRQPEQLTADTLTLKVNLPLDWREQRKMLGLP